ncbi:MAG: AAA family ATPase [Desulfobacterota bacterium]|nr:AAA family ATPase [Thermodesulfobacteriota bacterium]MDW8002276.1 AAA family ATPase [Deltaproteobacteria bacterium]
MVISIANQKGGVGKTTTAINLSASIAVSERKVLLIDMDSQSNATQGLGILYSELRSSIYDVLIGEKEIKEVIMRTEVPYLDIIPSHPDLIGAEVELLDFPEKESILKKHLEIVKEEYAYIVVDCPPSLGLLTINALVGSDRVLIPLQCEYFALEGLALLLRTIAVVKRRLNPSLDILGVLLTMFDKRNALSFRVLEEVKRHFSKELFSTIIPRNVRLSEASSYGKPVLLYDINSKGAESYLDLAAEVIERSPKCKEKIP